MSSTNALYPGATLGIIGLDRNGSTLITAAKRAGFNVGVYVDHAQPSLTKQADFTISGAYNNQEKLTMFAQTCDAIIYANDLIDSSVLRYLSRDTYLPQGVNALEIVQDRLMERAFLDQINVNVAPYVTVISLDDVYQSIDSIGYPAILKPIQTAASKMLDAFLGITKTLVKFTVMPISIMGKLFAGGLKLGAYFKNVGAQKDYIKGAYGAGNYLDAAVGALWACYKKYSEFLEDGGNGTNKQLQLVTQMTRSAAEDSNQQFQSMLEGLF